MSSVMESQTVESLLGDLLQWLNRAERPYFEVMDAWRTSCPRLPVWEEATERGLVSRTRVGGELIVGLSPAGRAFLAHRRA
jgi:D-3-phosphoglycerate dehydrogenase